MRVLKAFAGHAAMVIAAIGSVGALLSLDPIGWLACDWLADKAAEMADDAEDAEAAQIALELPPQNAAEAAPVPA